MEEVREARLDEGRLGMKPPQTVPKRETVSQERKRWGGGAV